MFILLALLACHPATEPGSALRAMQQDAIDTLECGTPRYPCEIVGGYDEARRQGSVTVLPYHDLDAEDREHDMATTSYTIFSDGTGAFANDWTMRHWTPAPMADPVMLALAKELNGGVCRRTWQNTRNDAGTSPCRIVFKDDGYDLTLE